MFRSSLFFKPAILLLICSATAFVSIKATTKDNDAEARRAVEEFFQALRTGDYNALYERLPSASQKRISRERFVNALQRTRSFYQLERLHINALHTAGDLAVVDTIVYGRARQFADMQGKIIARQYLVREGGVWRVTAGDRASAQALLAANPQFARKYPPRAPHVFVKQQGRWVDASEMARRMRKGSK